MQGRNIIDALAHINAGPEQVLIHVRYGPAIDINGGVAGKKMCEMRPFAKLWQNLDARLQNGISRHNTTAVVVNDRPIKWMRQNTHKPRT